MKKISAISISAIFFVVLIAYLKLNGSEQPDISAEATFSADYGRSELRFFFMDLKDEFCPESDGRRGEISINRKPNSLTITKGCWKILDNGNYKIILNEDNPIRGTLIIKKENVQLLNLN